jgi:hypothetical protein
MEFLLTSEAKQQRRVSKSALGEFPVLIAPTDGAWVSGA